MIDETFHLTPMDVRNKEFTRAMRGYDTDQVHQFREQVALELERLTRMNQDLESKAKNFHEQLRAFRERDKALNDALVSAQQLRGEIREQSEREAQLIVREARAQADHIIEAARTEIRSLQEELASLERMRRGYLAQLRLLVQRQLAEIEAAEGMPTARTPESSRPAEPRAAEPRPTEPRSAEPRPAEPKPAAPQKPALVVPREKE